MKRKPTKRQIDSLSSIIGRLADWQYRYHDDYNEVESGKRALLEAVSRLEQAKEAQ